MCFLIYKIRIILPSSLLVIISNNSLWLGGQCLTADKWLISVSHYYSVVKNLPASAGDTGWIPGSQRFLREGNGNPLQYPCLGNLVDREAWHAAVCGVAKNQTWLSDSTTLLSCLGERRWFQPHHCPGWRCVSYECQCLEPASCIQVFHSCPYSVLRSGQRQED